MHRRGILLVIGVVLVGSLFSPALAGPTPQSVSLRFVTTEICTRDPNLACNRSALSLERLDVWQLSTFGPFPHCEGTWTMTAPNGDGLEGAISRCGPSGTTFMSVTGGMGAFSGYSAPSTAQPGYPGLSIPLPHAVFPLCIPVISSKCDPVAKVETGQLAFTLTPPG